MPGMPCSFCRWKVTIFVQTSQSLSNLSCLSGGLSQHLECQRISWGCRCCVPACQQNLSFKIVFMSPAPRSKICQTLFFLGWRGVGKQTQYLQFFCQTCTQNTIVNNSVLFHLITSSFQSWQAKTVVLADMWRSTFSKTRCFLRRTSHWYYTTALLYILCPYAGSLRNSMVQ